jgi:hypothetical protein
VSTLYEETYSGYLRKVPQLWEVREVRCGQRGDREFIFAGEVEGNPAGHQHVQTGAGDCQSHYLWGGHSHLLKVIEEQQQVFLVQKVAHVIRVGMIVSFPQTECPGNGWHDLFWIADGSKGNKTDAICKGVSDRCC